MYFPKSEGNSLNIFWTHISGSLWRIVHQLEEEKVDELCSKASKKYANLDDKNELCSKTFPSEEIVAGMQTLCTRKNRRRMHFLLKERTTWNVFLAIMDYLLTSIILERVEWKRVFVQTTKMADNPSSKDKARLDANVQIAKFGIWLWRHLWWGIALFQHFFSSFGMSEKEFSYESAANPPAADCRISDGAIFGASLHRDQTDRSPMLSGEISRKPGGRSRKPGELTGRLPPL